MINLAGYEINGDNVTLRILSGNKEHEIHCVVCEGFFETLGKDEGINLLTEYASIDM